MIRSRELVHVMVATKNVGHFFQSL